MNLNAHLAHLIRRRRPRQRPLILFVPDNDTICTMFAPVIRELTQEPRVDVAIGFLRANRRENAVQTFANTLQETVPSIGNIDQLKLARLNPAVLVVGNDYGKAKRLIMLSRRLRVPTVCVQESVIDFDDTHRRMRHAEFVFLQGRQSAYHLTDREGIFITGNPRYELYKVIPHPPRQSVLINVNFTYEVEKQARDGWVQSAVTACQQAPVDFHLSQHPRDTGDLKSYGERVIASGVSSIRRQLEDHTLVISRFSSLLHEALLLGRKAIYYNPHREKIGYDFTPDNLIIFVADSQVKLMEVLQQALDTPFDRDALDAYRDRHLHAEGESPARRNAEELLGIVGIARPSRNGQL